MLGTDIVKHFIMVVYKCTPCLFYCSCCLLHHYMTAPSLSTQYTWVICAFIPACDEIIPLCWNLYTCRQMPLHRNKKYCLVKREKLLSFFSIIFMCCTKSKAAVSSLLKKPFQIRADRTDLYLKSLCSFISNLRPLHVPFLTTLWVQD